MKRITKDLYEKLLDAGLIDTTKNNSNCYTSIRRKNKYVCEQTLIDLINKYLNLYNNIADNKKCLDYVVEVEELILQYKLNVAIRQNYKDESKLELYIKN